MKLVLSLLLLVSGALCACQPGWQFFGGSCYKLHRNANFQKAKKICQNQGAMLASVHSDEENSFIAGLTRQPDTGFSWFHHTWIGLERQQDDEFYNVDGSEVDYDNWYEGEPNNWENNENCAVILNKSPPGWMNSPVGKWGDVNCAINMKFYVCKKGQ